MTRTRTDDFVVLYFRRRENVFAPSIFLYMPKNYKIVSWNVNGIRAVLRKGLLEWMDKEKPDIVCLQETRAHPEQLPKEVVDHKPYRSYWHSASIKKGYSGVVTYSKIEPLRVETGFGLSKFDEEGRVVMTEFPEFVLYNVYFPNGKKDSDRLNFKLEFYEAFLKKIDGLRKKGKKVIFCGDVNTAHRDIDLSRPAANAGISGFLPIERKWIDRVIEHGFVDALRALHPEPRLYTWWDLKSGARARNVGWRIDYFFIQRELLRHLKSASILKNVMGSDHCPISLELKF